MIIHIIVSYDQNISLIFLMWKMDPMSGFDIRLVFILPPRDSTLQYKRCVHFWNNFPCITSLLETFPILFTCLCIICLGFQRKWFYFCAIAGPVISAQFRSLTHKTRTLARNSAQLRAIPHNGIAIENPTYIYPCYFECLLSWYSSIRNTPESKRLKYLILFQNISRVK